MIELAGFFYEVAKDLKRKYFDWVEKDMLVEMNWLEASGMKKKADENNLILKWSLPKKIETRRLDGWEIIYKIDEKENIKYRITLYDGSVLIGKQ